MPSGSAQLTLRANDDPDDPLRGITRKKDVSGGKCRSQRNGRSVGLSEDDSVEGDDESDDDIEEEFVPLVKTQDLFAPIVDYFIQSDTILFTIIKVFDIINCIFVKV